MSPRRTNPPFAEAGRRGRAFVRLPAADLPKRYLKPGDLMICREPCEVTTVLGSCVAVTFFSARLKLAAICHAMLPAPRRAGDRVDFWANRWKYVSAAVAELIGCFQRAGPPGDVEVKIFGGAHLLQSGAAVEPTASVGSANVAFAHQLLAAAGYAILAADVGGTIGRKLVFNTLSGAVHVKRLNPAKVAA
jgi:chemotaxis protein CheD